MSKRQRVPTPFQKLMPSIIRGSGPRFVLTIGAAAALLLFISGGSYLISHATPTDPQPVSLSPKAISSTYSEAHVLGAATTKNTSNPTTEPVTTPTETTTVSTPAAAATTLSPTPTCAADCSNPTHVTPSTVVTPLVQSAPTNVLKPVTTTLQTVFKLGTGLL